MVPTQVQTKATRKARAVHLGRRRGRRGGGGERAPGASPPTFRAPAEDGGRPSRGARKRWCRNSVIPWTAGGWDGGPRQLARDPASETLPSSLPSLREVTGRKKSPSDHKPQKASRPRGPDRVGGLRREASSGGWWRESAPSSVWEPGSLTVLQVSAEFRKESQVAFRRSAPPRVF